MTAPTGTQPRAVAALRQEVAAANAEAARIIAAQVHALLHVEAALAMYLDELVEDGRPGMAFIVRADLSRLRETFPSVPFAGPVGVFGAAETPTGDGE